MKKIIAAAAVLGLVVGALGVPASAAKKKPKPTPITMFFHGAEPIGEIDMANNLAAGGTVMAMDTEEPTGSPSKSFPFNDFIATPNEKCSGSPLFPSWSGNLAGRVTGDIKVVFNTIASAGTVDVELFADAGPLSCNDTYIPPAAEVTVDLPPGSGTVEAVIEGVDFVLLRNLVIMINPKNLDVPAAGRVLYDSGSDASRVELMCTPAAGAASCTG